MKSSVATFFLLFSMIAATARGQNPVPLGSEFQVNTYTTSSQQFASVAVDSDGDFVVVWSSDGSSGTDSDRSSVQGQRYDATGAPIGGEFQVNTTTTGSQNTRSVAVEADGDFVVVWSSYGSSGSDTSLTSVQGQRYDAAGAAVGGEFQVNIFTTSYQRYPSVAVEADGDFVVVWESSGSSGSDTSYRSVQGQRFATPFFTDGFESGDTTAWSGSMP